MRALALTDGKWIESRPPDLARWVWDHRGDDAVVVDDGPPKVFYCNRLTTIAKYKESGKDARPFSELYRRLPVAGADNPLACGDGVGEGVAVCSERQSCQGKQLHCGGKTNDSETTHS